MHTGVAQRGVCVGQAVEAAGGAAYAREHAREVPHVPVGSRAVRFTVEQVAEQLVDARASTPQVAGGEVRHECDRVLECRYELEQAGECVRIPRSCVGDRSQRSAGELGDRVEQSGGRGARRIGVVDQRQLDAVVAPARFAVRQRACLADA